MRILFASTHLPDDRRVYSGITYHMRIAFERAGATVIPLAPLRAPGAWWMKPKKLLYRMAGVEHERLKEPRLVREYALQIEAATRRERADVAFGTGVHLVGAVTDVPFSCWPDTTFAALSRLYEVPRPYSQATLRNGHALEHHTFAHATGVAFSSDWARSSALNDYNAPADRVVTIPYGANLDPIPERESVDAAIARRAVGTGHTLELLFVGKEFERKGGPAAVSLAGELYRQGIPVVLRIVGPNPEATRAYTAPWVVTEGFLDAQRETDRRRLAALYASAHIFVMPTQADCTPMVLVEAMANGVPCLTSHVGGIPSQITPGSGLLVSPNAPVADWADTLMNVWASPERYRALATRARERYDTVLNWDTAAHTFLRFLEDRLRADGGRPRRPASSRT